MKLQMANQFLQTGELDQAEMLYQQVLADDPGNVHAIRSLGSLYAQQNKHDRAVPLLRKAIELEPANANMHLKLANQYMAQEQSELARDCFRRVVELRPRHIDSLVALAHISRQTEHTHEIQMMEDMYKQPDISEDERRRLAFTLGKVFDDLGDYDKAFGFFQAGNRIARAEFECPTDAETKRFRHIREHFDKKFFKRYRDAGIADKGLIIFVGMPRSGTTLVEQILSSHPDVYGAGEVENLHKIILELQEKFGTFFPVGFKMLDVELLQEVATRYAGELRDLAGGESYITDKNLGSIPYLGLISVMLPNAKIIHCKRDPRDAGLSFYQIYFGKQQVFSYDLEDIGRFFNRSQGLMDYWNRMFPGRIYEINYEDVVADLDGSIRRLLEHCNLPFDDACLSFHNTKRVVNTASNMQVHQPLYASSVGRWKNYERHLQPLITALGL